MEEYCENIVKSQWPLNEIAPVLVGCLHRLHICVFLKGKYWTTNRDESLIVATIYLVYCGNLRFSDTVQKGSLHEGMPNNSPTVNYYLKSKGLEDNLPGNTTLPTPAPVYLRKTLNSLQAGLTKEKELKVKC